MGLCIYLRFNLVLNVSSTFFSCQVHCKNLSTHSTVIGRRVVFRCSYIYCTQSESVSAVPKQNVDDTWRDILPSPAPLFSSLSTQRQAMQQRVQFFVFKYMVRPRFHPRSHRTLMRALSLTIKPPKRVLPCSSL